jgi:hypothetical protein
LRLIELSASGPRNGGVPKVAVHHDADAAVRRGPLGLKRLGNRPGTGGRVAGRNHV